MLENLFVPQSVAVVGASRTPGKVGHEILSNLIEGGYQGNIVPINPAADEILGQTCYPNLKAYGHAVDLTLMALPAPSVAKAATEVFAVGSQAMVVLAAGFSEAGVAGIKHQEQLTDLCRKAGVRLLGPNCLGIINTAHRLNASFSKGMPKTGPISVVSQSGAICTALLDWAASRDLGLAKVISLGNRTDLNVTNFLEALTYDDQTEVVVGYLEGIREGDPFIKAARTLSQKKPFILLRSGVTPAGIWAAAAHTGNLAGADHAYNAAFKVAGILRADTLDGLFDQAVAFATQPLPVKKQVAVITNSGGAAVLAADTIEQAGLSLATLSDITKKALHHQLPPGSGDINPIDLRGDAGPERYSAAITAIQQDPAVDAIVAILAPHATTPTTEIMSVIGERLLGDKPVLAVLLGGPRNRSERLRRSRSHVPFYTSPERAIGALQAMHGYRLWREQPVRIVTRFPVNRRRVERILSRHRRSDTLRLGEAQAKEILRAYDFQVPAGQIADSREEALEIAERIGYPVALKIVSPDVIHKSDVGGIKLNVTDPEEVLDSYDLLTLRLARRAPEARIVGVTVEKMCSQGLHVVLGVTDDARFGPMLVFGLGGTYVDRLEGLSCYLAPISADEALQILTGTRSYALLQEARGQTEVDLHAITGALQRLSQLATDFPQIKEVNINPYIVGSPGTVAMAVDASIRLREDV